MSDKPVRFIGFGPDSIELAIAPDGNVVVKLLGCEKEAGLTPGVGVMMVLTPEEARKLGLALGRTADKAESRSAQP